MLRHIFALLLFSMNLYADDQGVTGKVHSVPACAKSVMVWLSLDEAEYSKRLLLMHSEVPVGGRFQFFTRPGNYELRATDDQGCEFSQKIKVTKSPISVTVRMKK